MAQPTNRVRAPQVRRVALYSHDTQGLGHIRRNIAVAAALVAADPATNVLLLTGAAEATALPLPPRTEVLTLPAVAKDLHGAYTSRVLDAPLSDVLDLRTAVMTAALLSFRPDLLVVDKVARGVGRELDGVLDVLRAALPTRVVLGLREILDDPEVTRAEWRRDRTDEVLAARYDAVWVYGDPAVFDTVAEYGLSPQVAAMTSYTGYLGRGRGGGTRTRSRSEARVHPPRSPYALCLVAVARTASTWPTRSCGQRCRTACRAWRSAGPTCPPSTAGSCGRRRGPTPPRGCWSSSPTPSTSSPAPRPWCRWTATTACARCWPQRARRCSCPGSGPGWSSWSAPSGSPTSAWSRCSTPTAARRRPWVTGCTAPWGWTGCRWVIASTWTA